MKSLPAPVRRRLKALKKLQMERVKVESKFYEEIHQLEAKYAAKFTPLDERRAHIISGDVEPTDRNGPALLLIHPIIIICAIAGILLKPRDVYFFFSTILVVVLNNSDICSAVTIIVRFKFLKLPTTISFSCYRTSEWYLCFRTPSY